MKNPGPIFFYFILFFFCITFYSCDFTVNNYKRSVKISNRYVHEIVFENEVASSDASKLFKLALPYPEMFLYKESDRVVKTLYYPDDSSMQSVDMIKLSLKDFGKGSEMIPSKHNDYESGSKTIEYNTRWVSNSFGRKDTAYLKAQTRGVLCHELTHVYQLKPYGIGNYNSNKIYKAYVEGMADAVRYLNGYYTDADREKGGNYTDGYKHTGFFFAWITLHKDKNFLRKINQSTLHVIPWSFDGAIKYALGKQYKVDLLWLEYLREKGDITPEMAKKA